MKKKNKLINWTLSNTICYILFVEYSQENETNWRLGENSRNSCTIGDLPRTQREFSEAMRGQPDI